MIDNSDKKSTGSRDKEKKMSAWAKVILVLLILMLVYVLSIGPVYAVGMSLDPSKSMSPAYRSFCSSFYAPLFWVGGNTALGVPLGWYLRLWFHIFGVL